MLPIFLFALIGKLIEAPLAYWIAFTVYCCAVVYNLTKPRQDKQ